MLVWFSQVNIIATTLFTAAYIIWKININFTLNEKNSHFYFMHLMCFFLKSHY